MKKQIIIIHGGDVFDTYNKYLAHLKSLFIDFGRLIKKGWKETLGEKLRDDFQVIAPSMPDKNNARYEEWKIFFEKLIPFLGPEIILIGHSLGGIFLAKYLAENRLAKKVIALFLVAAPFGENESVEFLADFILPKSLTFLNEQVGKIFIYHSEDDPVVAFSDASKYQQSLPQAKLKLFKNRGHFSGQELPELIEEIKNLR